MILTNPLRVKQDWRSFTLNVYQNINGVINPTNPCYKINLIDLSNERRWGKADDSAIIPTISIDINGCINRVSSNNTNDIATSIIEILFHELQHLEQKIDKQLYIAYPKYRQDIEDANIIESHRSILRMSNIIKDKFNIDINTSMLYDPITTSYYQYREAYDMWYNAYARLFDGTTVYYDQNISNVDIECFGDVFHSKISGRYNLQEFYRFQQIYFKMFGFNEVLWNRRAEIREHYMKVKCSY